MKTRLDLSTINTRRMFKQSRINLANVIFAENTAHHDMPPAGDLNNARIAENSGTFLFNRFTRVCINQSGTWSYCAWYLRPVRLLGIQERPAVMHCHKGWMNKSTCLRLRLQYSPVNSTIPAICNVCWETVSIMN